MSFEGFALISFQNNNLVTGNLGNTGIQSFKSISEGFVVHENQCSPEQLRRTGLGSIPVLVWSIELCCHFLEFCPLFSIKKGTSTAVSPTHWRYLPLNCPLRSVPSPSAQTSLSIAGHFDWLKGINSLLFSSV